MEPEPADTPGLSPAADESEDPATVAILMAIEASRTSLMTRIDTLALECGLIKFVVTWAVLRSHI